MTKKVTIIAISAFVFFIVFATAGYLYHWAFAKSNPKTIIEKIEDLKLESLKKQLADAGFSELPKYYTMRIYKHEGDFEIWAGMDDKSPLKRLATYSICAMDFVPGPKLKEGDSRTPEGSFELEEHYSSRNWFMHINLEPGMMDVKGTGDAFYYCTDYPTSFNKALSKSIGISNPGSAICIHGNCVSAGCVSMENDAFVEIYYWMMQHDKGRFGAPRAHILPFRFYEECSEPNSEAQFCMAEGKGVHVKPIEFLEKTRWHKKYHDRLIQNHQICISPDNELTKMGCPSPTFKKIKDVAEKASQVDENSKKLGPEMLEKLWLHIAEREKQFLASPNVKTAELELTAELLK